jgi:ribosomal protein S18 acetylase RimI-like enzyme
MDDMTVLRKIEETFMCIGYRSSIPGLLWPVQVPGVTARVSPLQSGLLNLVGLATFTEDTVDKGIQQVLAGYQQEEKIFTWSVGPTSQPASLGEHLVAAGLTRRASIKGMVLRDIHHTIKSNPEVQVKQVPITDWDKHGSMLASAYGIPLEVVNILNRCYETLGNRAMFYLAYVPGEEEPVAFSASAFEDNGIVALLGAATLEAYRGRGIYTSMVAKRLDDALARGATTAIIQSDPDTSAPICARLGFEHICSLDLYTL